MLADRVTAGSIPGSCPGTAMIAGTRSAHSGQLPGGNVFEIAQPLEQKLRRDAGAADVEAGPELVEQFALAQRKLGMAAGAAPLRALDPLAVYQLDDHLVIGRGAADLRIVILICDHRYK